ncbi:protoporphyrinogen oxidase [Auraticoccus monumenti]|uniref:Coproporphyrinogen III oxidase n=1 Tax=Auraticoccus monumenti TaxID=675864 RepID=A0A1G7C8D8_9ACTN|nr:protoporphyrinogen oxidase [Auraticoccus monumenti]SDE34936.1 oxygen-dependent protoporphyrinogen oxidase [Auraticoccus monumenti]
MSGSGSGLRVAVVGAGVSGLAAACALVAAGAEVTVLERSDRPGGKLRGAELDGVTLDVGAESMLLRGRPELVTLLDELGLSGALTGPTAAKPAILVGGRAVGIPRSLMGVPADLEALRPLLSPEGWRRAAEEPSLPAPPTVGDVAIGALVSERFGPEVTDRLLEPLLGGVYAGHSRELSTAAVNPRLWELARAGGSLLEGAAAALPPSSGGSPFTGVVGGVHRVVDALAAALGDRLRLGTTVHALERTAGGWRLSTGAVPRPERLEVDAVVLAVPAPAAARLLDGTPAQQPLAGVRHASPAVVALRVTGVEPDGSGLLVPPGELAAVKAVTHAGRKWAWLGESTAGAWGAGHHLVRVSLGRLGEEHLLQRGDEDLVGLALTDLRRLPGWADVSVVSHLVQRWGGGLPQYEVGHLDRVAAVERGVADLGALAVCGAAYHGVGVGPCLSSGLRAAAQVLPAA